MINMLREWIDLVEGKYRKPIQMYHGTSSVFFHSILKNGIIPNPQKKKWDKDENISSSSFSRQSLNGSYWSSNLMTAISSASNTTNKFGGNSIIVIAQIAEQSSYADEDNLNSAIKYAISDTVVDIYPQIISSLWLALAPDVFHKTDKTSKIEHLFAEHLHKNLKGNDKQPIDYNLTNDLLKTLILRNIYFETQYGGQSRKELWNIQDIQVPSINEIEEHLLLLREKLTRKYKNSVYFNDQFNHTLRTEDPVNYAGSNKILSIIEYKNGNYNKEEDKWIYYPLKLLYGRDDNLDNFIKQYEKFIGPFPGLVNTNNVPLIKGKLIK